MSVKNRNIRVIHLKCFGFFRFVQALQIEQKWYFSAKRLVNCKYAKH